MNSSSNSRQKKATLRLINSARLTEDYDSGQPTSSESCLRVMRMELTDFASLVFTGNFSRRFAKCNE